MRNDTAAGRDFGANVGANAGTPPVAFVVAVWLGMPREEILRGLGEGWIAPPPGSPPGWTPAAWAAGPAAAGAPVGTAADGNPLGTTTAGSPVESLHVEYDPGPTRDDPARADVGLRGDDPPLADSALVPPWPGPGAGDDQRSAAWIDDRARFVAWQRHAASGGAMTIAGDDAWSFVDHARRDATGEPVRLDIAAAGDAARTHQVVFGSAAADVIAGGGESDRIHGDAGDDWIRGGGGDDLIEGERGDDALAGGRGNDDLAGGRGDDDLDGGAGADRLDGGSGDDVLAGGRGDDLLEGGGGDDTYVFDGGDGVDTIVDADGRGRIVVDDRVLSGGTLTDGGEWRSADGTVTFRFSGDPQRGGELSITVGAGSGPDATNGAGGGNGTILVRGFRNGNLGLTFGDGSDAALAAGADGGTIAGAASDQAGDAAVGATFASDGGDEGADDSGERDATAVADNDAAGNDAADDAAAGNVAGGPAPDAGPEAPLLPPWPDAVAAMGRLPDLATIFDAGYAGSAIAAAAEGESPAGSMPGPDGDACADCGATEAWYDGGPGSTEIASADAAVGADGADSGVDTLASPFAGPQALPWASWWEQGTAPVPPLPERPTMRNRH